MTLLEYAKTAFNKGQFTKAAVVDMFARASSWLNQLPFMTIQGNAYAYNREGQLPGIAFRGVNESYTPSTGIINPFVESLRISGGDITFDNFLLRTLGEGRRALEENMKVKALAAGITTALIKGDSADDPREFDGLQARITGDQRLTAGNTDGGDALSLAVLDELIDAVPGCNAIWLSKAMRRRFSAAARDTSISGNIEQTKDDFGRPQLTYAGRPLVVPYEDNDGVEPLGFDEVNPGAGSTATATSIYALNIGEGRVAGIQSQPMDVRDLGEMESAPKKLTRVEWDIGLVVEHGRAAARLAGISDAAIVA